MPGEALHWMIRVKNVERHYDSAQWAARYVVQAAQADPTILGGWRRRDIRDASDRLEGTFVVLSFTVFEEAMRAFVNSRHINQPRWAEQLINRVGNLGTIPTDVRDKAQAVREYRNSLVHPLAKSVEPLSLRQVTSYICTFLDRLKQMW